MKYIIIITIMLSGCTLLDECQPGDYEGCNCGVTSYVNRCTMDGYYMECECYSNQVTGPISPPPTGAMTGGSQESLDEWYSAPAGKVCDDGEISIPGRAACVRICPAGMDWLDGECIGWPSYGFYDEMADKCKSYHPEYRIISIDELSYLLDECYPLTFNYQMVNYCSSYLESPMRNVMQLPDSAFTTWVGELETCDDAYGYIGLNCSWEAKFYLNIVNPTEFNFFRATSQYGSALSGAICVR